MASESASTKFPPMAETCSYGTAQLSPFQEFQQVST